MWPINSLLHFFFVYEQLLFVHKFLFCFCLFQSHKLSICYDLNYLVNIKSTLFICETILNLCMIFHISINNKKNNVLFQFALMNANSFFVWFFLIFPHLDQCFPRLSFFTLGEYYFWYSHYVRFSSLALFISSFFWVLLSFRNVEFIAVSELYCIYLLLFSITHHGI